MTEDSKTLVSEGDQNRAKWVIKVKGQVVQFWAEWRQFVGLLGGWLKMKQLQGFKQQSCRNKKLQGNLRGFSGWILGDAAARCWFGWRRRCRAATAWGEFPGRFIRGSSSDLPPRTVTRPVGLIVAETASDFSLLWTLKGKSASWGRRWRENLPLHRRPRPQCSVQEDVPSNPISGCKKAKSCQML